MSIFSRQSIILHVYVYIVSLVGLLMIAIPTVQLIQIAMRTWIFTAADEVQYGYYPHSRSPAMPYPAEKFVNVETVTPRDEKPKSILTEEEVASVRQAIEVYNSWNETEQAFQKKANKQRDLVQNLAFIIVGLPLFALHWRLARKLQHQKQETA